ncbi:MAG: VOC family protein [Acidobacteriota bacterium]
MTKPVPEGYHSVTPYLMLRGAAKAIEFYKKAFGAEEVLRMPMPDGRLGHAEIRIGDSHVMMADEFPEMDYVGPQSRGGTTVSLMLYVDDCDAVFNQAVAAGAVVKKPMADQFYGDRVGSLEDPFGHFWSIGTHKEDLSEEELQKRMAEQKHG